MTFSLTIKTADDLAADALARERNGMRVFKRALRLAMTLFPSTTHVHKLAEIDAAVDALPAYHPAKAAWSDVTEFQRMNPDVAALAAPFGFYDESLDALFVVAMALERGATEAEALATL